MVFEFRFFHRCQEFAQCLFNSFSPSVLVEWNKLNSNIGNSLSDSTFKKKILNFIRPRSNDAFNVSHPKGLIFLTRLRVGISHLIDLKFKQRFLDTLDPICVCGLDIDTLNHFFLDCPRFTNENQNLKIERIIPNIFRKTDSSITYFFMAIEVFQLNLTPTYSIYLLITDYTQKSLNLLSLQRLDS